MIPGTVIDDIAQGSRMRISHRLLNREALLHRLDGERIRLPIDSLINDFLPLIKEYIFDIELDEASMLRYRFSPKKLSYDLYETTQYWSILLYMNECHSILDFEPKKIRFIDPGKIDVLINEILILGGKL